MAAASGRRRSLLPPVDVSLDLEEEDPFDDSFVIGDVEKDKRKSRRDKRKSLHQNNLETLNFNDAYSKLTSKEKDDHFSYCMKLADQNKITAKNAFGLHLINYMMELTSKEDETNFQVAGIALQASAKIYGVRVDTLHHEIINMARNLTINNKKKDKKGQQEDRESGDVQIPDDDPSPPPAKKAKKKRKFKKESLFAKLTPVNTLPGKFSLVPKTLQCGTHVRGLLSRLPVANDFGHVKLSAPQPTIKKITRHEISKTPANVPTEFINEFISKYTKDDIPLPSQTLAPLSFMQIRWPLNDPNDLAEYKHSEVEKVTCMLPVPDDIQDSQPSFNEPPHSQSPLMSCGETEVNFNDADSNDFPAGMNGSDSVFESESNDQGGMEVEDNVYLPPPPDTPTLTVADVTQCLSVKHNDYNLLDPEKEKFLLMGLKILRAKSVVKDPPRKPKGRTKKGPELCNLKPRSDEEEQALNENFLHSKKKLILSDKVLINYEDRQEIEMEDEFNLLQLISLFNVDAWERRGVKEDCPPIPEGMRFDSYLEKETLNEPVSNVACHSPTPFGGEDYDAGADFNDYDHDSIPNPDLMSGDNAANIISIVPEPMKVKKDLISYEKIAKKINQKLIKRHMWKILVDGPDILSSEKSSTSESSSDTITKMPQPMNFRKVFHSLKQKLPEDASTDISVPISFVVLLQLANEHNLFIAANSQGQVIITQPD